MDSLPLSCGQHAHLRGRAAWESALLSVQQLDRPPGFVVESHALLQAASVISCRTALAVPSDNSNAAQELQVLFQLLCAHH